MKKLLFILTVFLCSSELYAQQYIPMPTDSASWRSRHIFTDQGFYTITDFIVFLNGEDTVMNNITYKKLIVRTREGDYGFGSLWPPYTGQTANYADFCSIGMREYNKVVYLKSSWWQTEKVFFDFNSQVGDTVYPIQTVSVDTVISIDSVLIGSTYRKRFNIGLAFIKDSYIEGIGNNSTGIIRHPNVMMDQHHFHCFNSTQSYNTASYSPPTFTDSCGYINPLPVTTGLFEVKNEKTGAVYPNPFEDVLNVQTSTSGQLAIYNSLGQQVKTQSFYERGIQIVNGFMELPEGLYFLYVKDLKGNIVQTEKLNKK